MSDKVFVATYRAYSVFKIPDGIDIEKLEKENKVFVKWDTLHIFVGEDDELSNSDKWLKIEATISASDCDFKRPVETEISTKEEWGLEDEEEEDECESCGSKENVVVEDYGGLNMMVCQACK